MPASHLKKWGRRTVQLDLTEIKEHLGIPPRDELTRQELEDLHSLKSS